MIQTRHYEGINHTPAVELLVRAQSELLRDGLVIPQVMIFWDDRAVVAFSEDDRAIGVISYAKPWGRELDIRLGYVLPEHRRLGVYRLMWDALVVKARELGATSIVGATRAENTAMRRTAAALQREELGIILRYTVDPRPLPRAPDDVIRGPIPHDEPS
jgi:hypothetical protein